MHELGGTGLIWPISGGISSSRVLRVPVKQGTAADFSFAQISDSHIGFSMPANPGKLTGDERAFINGHEQNACACC